MLFGRGGQITFSGEVCIFKAVSLCKVLNFLKYFSPFKVLVAFFDTLCLCQWQAQQKSFGRQWPEMAENQLLPSTVPSA